MKHFAALDAARRQPHCRTAASRAPRERRGGRRRKEACDKGPAPDLFRNQPLFYAPSPVKMRSRVLPGSLVCFPQRTKPKTPV